MINEDKQLLLVDLCGRLPYRVRGKCEIDASYDTSFDTIFQLHKFDAILEGVKEDLLFVTPLIEDKDEQEFANEEVVDGVDILDFMPYLRPMSSMTEEERKEIGNLIRENRPNPYGIINNKGIDNLLFSVSVTSEFLIDWLNKKMFDYRGLIPKGLAIEVTENDNPYKN